MNVSSQSAQSSEQDSKKFYLVMADDDLLIKAMVFWDARHAEVQGKVIGRQESRGRPSPLEPHEKLAIQASRLASHYWEATMKSPKARVAYWHALGRLAYPTLPRFQPGHRLPPTQSTHLHEIFKSLGRTASYVLAFAFAYWGTFQRDTRVYRAPEVEDLRLHSLDFVIRHWIQSLLHAEKETKDPTVAALIKRFRLPSPDDS